MKTLVEEVKAHALSNYDSGWDVVIECRDDDQILNEVKDCKTPEEAIKLVGWHVEYYNEQKDEVCSEIF